VRVNPGEIVGLGVFRARVIGASLL